MAAKKKKKAAKPSKAQKPAKRKQKTDPVSAGIGPDYGVIRCYCLSDWAIPVRTMPAIVTISGLWRLTELSTAIPCPTPNHGCGHAAARERARRPGEQHGGCGRCPQ